MKQIKFLAICLIFATVSAFSTTKPDTICTGTRSSDGGKIKLMIEDGKKFFQYFDSNGNETSERFSTQMGNKEFEIFAGSRGYHAFCG